MYLLIFAFLGFFLVFKPVLFEKKQNKELTRSFSDKKSGNSTFGIDKMFQDDFFGENISTKY